MSSEQSIIEHVAHETIGDLLGFRSPIRNFFQLLLCASLLPELTPDFLCFSDDFVLLRNFCRAEATTIKYLENLHEVQSRGKGAWIDSLWRTYDVLKQQGYPCYNFETHTPAYFRKRWIINAYRDLQDWVCADPWQGILGITSVLNHALKKESFNIESIAQLQLRAGFYGKQFDYREITAHSQNKLFFNYDDRAFGPAILMYLHQLFPSQCRYERNDLNMPHPSAHGHFQTDTMQ